MCKAFVIAMLFVACATGGNPEQQTKADASVRLDGQSVLPGDAPVSHADAHQLDAFVFLDAPPAPDAAAGGGFCTDNTNCHAAGECCFVAVCIPGQAIGTTVCLPH